jgi:hypothetical protein
MGTIEQPRNAFRGTQPVATTYYGLGGDASMIHHVQIQWDATLAATITFESSDFTEIANGASVTPGDWVQENPPTGYTAIGAGATAATPLVIVIAGTTASGASVNLGNIGSRRLQAKVVCGTAGFLRICTHGKQ